jgi:hypothetical protein
MQISSGREALMPNDRREQVRDYTDSAWQALDHVEAVRAEGRRYRPARLYDRPQLSERYTAGKPQSVKTKGAQPRSNRAKPGRASAACPVQGKRQADLFE